MYSPWYYIPSVEEADGHVLSRPGVALHHLVARFEAGRSDFVHGGGLVKGLHTNSVFLW
jgi:hypothetical protein